MVEYHNNSILTCKRDYYREMVAWAKFKCLYHSWNNFKKFYYSWETHDTPNSIWLCKLVINWKRFKKYFRKRVIPKIKLNNRSNSFKSRKCFLKIWQKYFLMELIAYENHWQNVQNGPGKLGLWLPGFISIGWKILLYYRIYNILISATQ